MPMAYPERGNNMYDRRKPNPSRRGSANWNPFWKSRENDCLIVEDNTIYEIDLDCMECKRKEGKHF